MSTSVYLASRDALRERIMSRIDFSRKVEDKEVLDLIDDHITSSVPAMLENLSVEEKKKLRQDLFHSIRRLDVLQELVEDPQITEIMVNGPNSIFIEKAGELRPCKAVFSSMGKLEDVIQQIVGESNRVVNTSSPIVDCRLANGDRVNVVLHPVAVNGPILTIRRFPQKPITMEDLLHFGSISEEVSAFLAKCVKAGLNIFISGGTGSGKTTFLNVMSDCIGTEERVITIEDNAELQIRHVPNLVQLEARNANVEGCRPITIRDLIKSALRMRPDRIVVGEVRSGEAVDMLQAMNTGHDGSMSTIHANGCPDAVSRLETMVLMAFPLPLPAIRRQIASGVDILVHLGRLRDRSRRVLEIAEVDGLEDGDVKLNSLFRWDDRAGALLRTGTLIHTLKLERSGIPPQAEK